MEKLAYESAGVSCLEVDGGQQARDVSKLCTRAYFRAGDISSARFVAAAIDELLQA